MNKLTILMNCKNGERFLREALNSIINQTYKEWNLFFFDNQSNDKSKEIFDTFKDERFKYFYFKKHINLGYARKKAWEEIQSKYVAICDVDDIFLKERFEEQVNYMDNNDKCSVVGSNVYLIDNKSNRFKELNYHSSNDNLKKQIQYKHVFNSATLLFRKKNVDEVGGYNPFYEMVNDYDLLFRLSRKFEIASLNKTLVCNRQHDSNLSFKKIVKGQVELLSLQFKIMKSVNVYSIKLKLYKNITLTLMRIIYHYIKSRLKFL